MHETAAPLARRIGIARIEVLPLRIWLRFKRTMSKGLIGRRKDREWVMNPVMIRVESEDGVEGYARVWPPNPFVGETTDSIVAAIRHYFGPALIGGDALGWESTLVRLNSILPGNPVALAGLDIAIYDVIGKTLGLPVYKLLGGESRSIPLMWSVSLNDTNTMIDEALGAVQTHGLQLLSLKVGPSSRWEADVDTVKRVRQAVGNRVEIAVDANEGYDLPTALRTLRALEMERIAYVEQPLQRHDFVGLGALRSQTGVPILVDESAYTVEDAYRVVTNNACDGIVLKAWKSGGLTNAKKIAILAEAAGVRITVGGTAQGNLLEAAASAHLFSGVPAIPIAAEFALGLTDIDPDPVATLPVEFEIVNGATRPPNGPGLGVEIDLRAAKELALAAFTIDRPA